MLFAEKYRPKKISEVIGQSFSVQRILTFLKSGKKCALVYGPIGCGKTSAIHAISKELGYEIIELNAGDFRDREKIRGILGSAIAQKSLFFKKKIIFIDEIDNLSSKDYGGISEVNNLINSTSYPIILCANKPFEKKLTTLRKKAEMIEFQKVKTNDMLTILKSICEKENIATTETTLKKISLLTDGDVRAAINDLQASGENFEDVVISKRDAEITIFDALRTIFKSNSLAVLNALNNVNMELDEAMLWIDENLPSEYNKTETYNAYQALSKADIFKRRIIRQQYWRFLVYVNAMLTAGVSFSKQSPKINPVQYKRTTRLLKLWMAQSTKKKAVAKKFTEEMHCSTKKFFRELPYMKIICKDPSIRDTLSKRLSLNKEEMNFILGQNKIRYM